MQPAKLDGNPPPERNVGGRPRAPGESIQAARRRKESALADLREHEVRLKRGSVLERDDVVREWQDILRTVRAGMMAVPSRIRAQLPHLTPHDADVIDREIRTALEMLSKPTDDPAGDH